MNKITIAKKMLKMHIKPIGDTNIILILVSFVVPFLVTLFELLFWSSLTSEAGIVTYILLANVLQEQFNIYTPTTTSLWEGSIIKYYTRPVKIIPQLIYETIGKSWIPKWIMFSIPTVIITSIFGFDILPYDMTHFIFFLVSMVFTIIIGFEIDIIFSSIAIKLQNGCWAAMQIRNAIIIILSGQLIPFQILPNKLTRILELLPFASIASAPLTIYIGGDFVKKIFFQCFWAILLGVCSYLVFIKSEEGMISFGG